MLRKIMSYLAILGIFGCRSFKPSQPHLEMFEVNAGGLSGLAVEKISGDELILWTHSDRGPNGELLKNSVKRPFLNLGFTPFWVKLSVNLRTKEVKILETILLRSEKGILLTGLPNKAGDEIPVGPDGNPHMWDVRGVDPESICFDGQSVWMGEEYGPSLLKFSPNGRLLKRYIPQGSYKGAPQDSFKASLPSKLVKRKLNRGFEGVACNGHKIYAILQSPLPGEGKDVRIFEFDSRTEKVEKEFIYPLDTQDADKIGDLAFYENRLLVLEQNGETGKEGVHKVYKVDLDTVDLEGKLRKKLVVDLVAAGYSFAEKVEGLSVLGPRQLVVVNDNDFGVKDSASKSILGVIWFVEDI